MYKQLPSSSQKKASSTYNLLKSTPCSDSPSSSNQTTLEGIVTTPQMYNSKDRRQCQLTESIISLIAGNLLPQSFVESKRFHNFMSVADSKYQIPSKKYLKRKLLPKKCTQIRNDMMKLLQKTTNICVTADIWSSRQLRSFFGITAHFIVNWSLKSIMIGCSRFKGSHTGEAIMEEFQKTMFSLEISSKVSFVITDSAANMVKAFSLPGFEDAPTDDESDDESYEEGLNDDEDDNVPIEANEDIYDELHVMVQRVPCFAHTLQLVIKDGFKQAGGISKAMSKASAIIAHVQKSTHTKELLESEKCLKNATAVRWNSQFSMIRSILRIPEKKLASLDTHKLMTYDHKLLEDMVEILTPFETATHCV